MSSENIPRIIVKTKYIKGVSHKECYVKYLATRENASAFISSVMDQNIIDIATKENYVDYISHRPRERFGERGLFSDEGKLIDLNRVAKEIGQHDETVRAHIRMIAYSKDTHKGFVIPEGIAKIRKIFAKKSFIKI